MKRKLLLIALSAALLLLFLATPRRPTSPAHRPPAETSAPPGPNAAPRPPSSSDPSASLLGERLLRDYANPQHPPENDLRRLAQLMDNSLLLVKSATDRPLSANEDWAAHLRGTNPARERFLPDSHPALNPAGQLIDRWGTPLFFHALGARQHEIRSAGPDRTLWTDDDLHRTATGAIRRGANLPPPRSIR